MIMILYGITTSLMLRLPPLFRTRLLSEKLRSVKIIAHRGSKSEGIPENTIAAFESAITAGAHQLELDVWLTSDGHVVVFHDSDCTRMCGVDCTKISETRLSDLPAIRPPPDQSEHFNPSDPRCTAIPTLEKVLEAIPDDMPLTIEFKQNCGALIAKVLGCLKKHNRLIQQSSEGRTIWFSLDKPTNAALRRACPSLPTIVSVTEMLHVYSLYYTGLLPFVRIDAEVFGFPVDAVDYKRIRTTMKTAPEWLCQFLALLVGGDPPCVFMAEPMMRHLRARGMAVQLLGVDTEGQLHAAKRIGATGVLTNRPLWLSAHSEAGVLRDLGKG